MCPAARIGVIRDKDIARSQPVMPKLVENGLDGKRERAKPASDAMPLGQQLRTIVGDADAVVEHFINDRTLRGALERDEHLIAHRVEAILDDLQREGVERNAFARLDRSHHEITPISITILPISSTVARCP